MSASDRARELVREQLSELGTFTHRLIGDCISVENVVDLVADLQAKLAAAEAQVTALRETANSIAKSADYTPTISSTHYRVPYSVMQDFLAAIRRATPKWNRFNSEAAAFPDAALNPPDGPAGSE